jgi:hypothetical protein
LVFLLPARPCTLPTAVIMIAEKSLWNVFRKEQDPKELVRKWQSSIRTEIRGVERQMLGAAVHLAPAGSASRPSRAGRFALAPWPAC